MRGDFKRPVRNERHIVWSLDRSWTPPSILEQHSGLPSSVLSMLNTAVSNATPPSPSMLHALNSRCISAALTFVLTIGIAVAQHSESHLRITSPANDSLVERGQSIFVVVAVDGSFPRGVAIIATLPIGASDIKFAQGPTLTFSVPTSSQIEPGVYRITAVGTNANGMLVQSDSVSVTLK